MKIVFASPERDLLLSYGRLLKDKGHNVITAFDGTQVVGSLGENPDILIIDEKMPRIPSGRLVETANKNGVPAIIMTYRADASDGDGTGMIARLPFPFTPKTLLALCAGMVNKSKNFDGAVTNGE